MQKIIYDTNDILEEFFRRAGMKGLSKESIDRIIPVIFSDSFKLVRVVKVTRRVRSVYYMCEWIEDGVQDSDIWTRPWENFIGSIAHNYICEAIKSEVY